MRGLSDVVVRFRWMLLASVVFLAATCGRATVVGERVCVPGDSVACACGSGAMGAKACAADGSGFGACVCGGPMPTGGASSTGGVGTGGLASSEGGAAAGGRIGTSPQGGSAMGGAIATGGIPAAGGAAADGGSGKLLDPETCVDPMPAADKLPCDVYAADGGPCVAAHSTVRKLSSSYAGPLYQLRKVTNDGVMNTHDILPTADGIADGADQDSFCATDACTISIVYDQSTQGNHLTKAPPGGAKVTPGNEANATRAPLMLAGGKKVYGLNIVAGVGYRNNTAKGTAKGDDAETEYMVVGGNVYSGSCCFDYGNMETNSRDNGEGTMEAVYFGSCTIWNQGGGAGPWVMGDLENGLWAGNASRFEPNGSVDFAFVTGVVKGDKAGSNHWNIKVGNAQSGRLTNPFNGPRPSARYNPMRKEGAIGLGTAGDNSNAAKGQFFEGVMTAHYASPCADEAVQANITAFYAKVQTSPF